MRDIAERVKAYLPYSMILTRVFEVFDIFLEGESFKKLLRHDEYCNRTLYKMGY